MLFFWLKWWHQKDISKLINLYESTINFTESVPEIICSLVINCAVVWTETEFEEGRRIFQKFQIALKICIKAFGLRCWTPVWLHLIVNNGILQSLFCSPNPTTNSETKNLNFCFYLPIRTSFTSHVYLLLLFSSETIWLIR